MIIEVLKSKLYGVFVTQTELHYEGITIDKDWMEQSELNEFEKVQVINLNNGARLETYVIVGERGKKEICMNVGGTQVGDELIILSYGQRDDFSFIPKPLIFKADSGTYK
jgi:aspartate 1-decarboxylase